MKRTWWSVASDIDELNALSDKLSNEDRGQKARLLSQKIRVAIPRFEATEEVCSVSIHKFEGMLIFLRNASDVNTDKHVRTNSSAQNLITPCMKAVLEGSA
jgi:hypothetical protein